MPLVAFFVVLAAGAAINIQNSADPATRSPKEFYERTVSSIEDGFSKDEFISFKLND